MNPPSDDNILDWLRDDVVYDFHHPLSGPGGCNEMVEDLAIWGVPDLTVRHAVMSVRGERLALIETVIEIPGSSIAKDSDVCESDDIGGCRYDAAWEARGLRLAMDEHPRLAKLVPGCLTLGVSAVRSEPFVCRLGTDLQGGEASREQLMASVVGDELIVASENSPPEQLAGALARFDEMLAEHRAGPAVTPLA